MSTQEQTSNILTEIHTPRPPDLRYIEGGKDDGELASEDVVQGLGVLCIKSYEIYEGRERREERLIFPDGDEIRSLVTEADPKTAADPSQVDTLVMVHGWSEMVSAGLWNSAFRMHDLHSRRRPGMRTVSVERLAYSIDDSPLLPWDGFRKGFEGDARSVDHILAAAAHYVTGKVALMGTSAGGEKVLKVAAKNRKASNKDKIDIDKDLTLLVPCTVATDVPEDARFRPEGENENRIRFDTTLGFILHAPTNILSSAIHNPRDTLNCVGIITNVAPRPWLWPVMAGQFISHTSGIPFKLFTDVTEYHNIIVVAAEKDPLEGEAQYAAIENAAIEKGDPGRVRYIKVPGEGHFSLPVNAKLSLDMMGMVGNNEQPAEDIIEAGLKLVTNTVVKVENVAEDIIDSGLKLVTSAADRGLTTAKRVVGIGVGLYRLSPN